MTVKGPGSQGALRQANLRRVIEEVRAAGKLTQAQISRHTGLSAASVTNLVRTLNQAGLVEVETGSEAGRQCRHVSLTHSPGYVLGIDLGRSHLLMCIADLNWQVVVEAARSITPETPAPVGLALCQQLQAELLDKANLDSKQLLAAGVGLPGPLDAATKEIGVGTLLPHWVDRNLEEAFQGALDLPVVVDNDANIGALGEFAWQCAERPKGTLIYLRLATGIGGGLMLGGQLHRGAAGTAGEVGHMTIDEGGQLCRCGSRGCLETVASTPVMLNVLSGALAGPVDLDTWIKLARQGHTASIRLLEAVGQHVGTAVANLCNFISPDKVVLGGPITAAGELLLTPVRQEVDRRAMPATSRLVDIAITRHASRTEMLGAVVLAREVALNNDPLASLLVG
ncbi:MAG: ROK family transcriptional regulator [Micrococcales bacterium]|nr:ROK family transcriptional regulator [Micrococcales bacterium]